MKNIDQRIQEALATEGAAANLAEPNLAEEVITAFRGRHRWLSAWMFVANLAFFALAVWAGVRFYQAGTVPEQLQWGALALLLTLGVCMMKLWFWLEMQSNRVLRELKRVELLLVSRRPTRDGE